MKPFGRATSAFLVGAILLVAPVASLADIDASGVWNFVSNTPYGPLACSDVPVVQTGSSLSIEGNCTEGGSMSLTGATDPVSGAFSIAGSSNPYCLTSLAIAGTSAPDGQSLSGHYDCAGYLGTFDGEFSGVRTGPLPPTPTPTPTEPPTPTPTPFIPIDVNGTWDLVLYLAMDPNDPGTPCSGVTALQDDTTLSISGTCSEGGSIDVSGSIDPESGNFSLSGTSEPDCSGHLEFSGSFTADGNEMSASVVMCFHPVHGPSMGGTITGVRTWAAPTPTPTLPPPTDTPTPAPATPTPGCLVPALSLPSAGGTVTGSTLAGDDHLSGSCGGDGASEVVYEWIPDVDGRFVIDTCDAGTDFDTVLYVREANCGDPDRELACNDDDLECGPQSRMELTVASESTYYVIVDGDYDEGDFTLTLTPSACIGATVIPAEGGTFAGTTSGVSTLHPSCTGIETAPEVAYAWTPSVSGSALITTCGAHNSFETALHVRSGDCEDPDQEEDCNSLECEGGGATVELEVIEGETYYIIVDGTLSDQSGDFVLTVVPPDGGVDNDFCHDAKPVPSLPYADVVDTTLATIAFDDPESSCQVGLGSKGVWYRFVAPADGTYAVDTTGSDYDTVVSVYTGSCGVFDEVVCADDPGDAARAVFAAELDEEYWIEVTDAGAFGGSLHLAVSEHCGDASECDDGNPCTDDTCSPLEGCLHTPNAAPCEDGSACTTGDTCAGGSCVPGVPLVCDDDNVCTDDSCDPGSGCEHVPNSDPCDDGSACTSGDTCAGGVCTGDDVDCDDGNVCTHDTCDPGTGCLHTPNELPCDDDNVCTLSDTCTGGVCVGGDARDCDDDNLCTADDCDPVVGCLHTPLVPGCGDDAYVAYKIGVPKKDNGGVPIPGNVFPKGWVIQLNDLHIPDTDAGDPESYVPSKPVRLLVAARSNAGPDPALPELAYVAYKMKLGRESVAAALPDGKFPKPAKHAARVWQLDTGMGTVNVLSKKAATLLVPARADLDGSPDVPGDATHYACYQVKVTRDVTDQTPDKGDGTGKLRKDLQGFFAEELFGDCALDAGGVQPSFAGTPVEGMCLFDLRKPAELCNPVDKTALAGGQATIAVIDESLAVRDGSLLCYAAKLAAKVSSSEVASLLGLVPGDKLPSKQAKHVPNKVKEGSPVYTTVGNQFPGPVIVDSKKQDVVCLPAEVLAVSQAE